ncbi:hypothetical protein Tco_0825451, partial [Tanacetum coccineum]
ALVISISSYSFDESVGSHVPRVILFGNIPISILVIPVVPAEVPITLADPLVAPEVGAVSVISPTGVLDLVDYSSSSDYGPSEDSLPISPELPLVSPFLCSDDSEADSESEPAEQRHERHESLTPSSEFPLKPVVSSPGIRQRPAILVRPSEAIPFGRPNRTHPNWPHFTSDSSSSSLSLDSSSDISSGLSSDSYSDSSSVHSSGCDASGQSHSGPSTRVVSPRLVDPPVRTPRCSKAFMCWRSAPLSTFYPLMTLESSLDSSSNKSLDSSSPSARPSRKRCISPDTLVLSSTHISRSIAPALADVSPRKRFRDSYSSEVSGEEHMEIGTTDAETVADLGISDGVGAPTEDGLGMGVEVATSNIREDAEEFEAEASAGGTMEIAVDPLVTSGISEPTGGDAPDLKGTLYDISHYMFEVPLDGIIEFETAQRQLEAGLLVAGRERAGLADREEFHQVRKDCDDTHRRLRRTMTTTRSGMNRLLQIEEMINRRVTEALETHKANRNIRLGNGNDEGGNGNGNGNGNGGGNGNVNHNENDKDARLVVRECMYQDFMKCQPLNFKGTKGVKNNSGYYTERFQELAMLFTKMVLEEEDRVEKFIRGLPDNIQGNVIVTEPTRLQDDVCMANNLMDRKLKGYAVKNVEESKERYRISAISTMLGFIDLKI